MLASIRRIVEPTQEQLNLIMERTGASDAEAHALYHLSEARRLVALLMPGPERFDEPLGAAVAQSFRTIENVIAVRVLERQFPEGWSLGLTSEVR
jgi:cell pole-organizing protein PopZ